MTETALESAERVNDISPADAQILEALTGGRNVPSNLADELGKNRSHISDRLAKLRRQGLVEQVGRKSISLHQITSEGHDVLDAWRSFQDALEKGASRT